MSTEAISGVRSPDFWWSDILKSKKLTDHKAKWKTIAADEIDREIAILSLYTRFKRTAYYSEPLVDGRYSTAMGKVYDGPGNFGFYMPGVALLASFLSEKKQIKGLYVCQTLEALITRLQEISVCDHDERCAFVVGSFQSGFKKRLPEDFVATPNFPQHKALVALEKRGGQVSVVLLDSQPTPGYNQDINPDKLTDDLWSGYDEAGRFNGQELVFRAIWKVFRDAKSDAKNSVRLLHSQVVRQVTYGCTVFALQAGIAFLRDQNFFDRIGCAQNVVKLGEDVHIEIITKLPPEYLLGTQSMSQIEKYRSLVTQSVFDEPIFGKKKQKSLQAYLDENCVAVLEEDKTKEQNHYMTKKFFKYIHFIVAACEQLPIAKVQEIVAKTIR